MKKTKIVVPALAVLLLSTAASVSGTVAWFSMNTTINVTGMSVTTKVSSSLQIAETNAEENFSNENLSQARTGLLEPASTVDGNLYYYTTDAKSNGDARVDSYVLYNESDIRNGDDPRTQATENNFSNALGSAYAAATGKTSYDPKFHDAYGFPAYDPNAATAIAATGVVSSNEVPFAYIDYSFYLKAFMQSTEKISLTTCNMKYNNGTLGQEHAWRVALFAHEVNLGQAETNATTTGTAANLISILDFTESKNQNQMNRAVELAAGVDLTNASPKYYTDANCTAEATGTSTAGTYYLKGDQDPKAVNAVDGLDALSTYGYDSTNHENKEAAITVNATSNYVFKVVVRLWLEGEDITCRSDTFATLTNAWTLDLGFKLGSENGVKNITNTVA